VSTGAADSPYVGLVPFTERDASFFFGREAERRLLAANLQASRLTVLYGASGVGKSSLLGAGIGRDFADRAEAALAAGRVPSSILVVFKEWQADPVAALEAAVAAAVSPLLGEGGAGTTEGDLDEVLAEWLRRLDAHAADTSADADRPRAELLIVLDQFEEYFLYHGADEGDGGFADQFAGAVDDPRLRVNFVLSIREDAYAQLDRFEGDIPMLFGSNFRLEHLTREAARTAATEPVAEYNRIHGLDGDGYAIERDLVEAVLSEVEAGKLVLGSGGVGTTSDAATAGVIETPYLQLVLNRLWEEELREGSRKLRLETFDRLGRATGIVATHLDEALGSLSPAEQDAAAAVFHHLVTPSGMKIAQRAGDLAVFAERTESETEPVLQRLAGAIHILRPLGGKSYEIYHDALAGPILDWRARHLAQRERAQLELERQAEEERRRVELEEAHALARAQRRAARAYRVVAAALVVGLAGACVLVVWALRERDRAQTQESLAQARGLTLSTELAKNARQQLSTNPALSVLLAKRALEVARTPLAEEMMRSGLIRRVRAVLPAGYDARFPFLAPVFTRDGSVLVTWSLPAGIRLWATSTGEPLAVPGSSAALSATMVPVSPDGRFVVRRVGGRAEIYSVATRERVARLKGETADIGADFSADGRLVATARSGSHAGVRVWEAQTGKLVATLRPRSVDGANFVSGANFGASSRYLATRSPGVVDLWDAMTGRRVRHLAVDTRFGPTTKALPSADGRRVSTRVPRDGRVWDVATGRTLVRSTVDTTRFPLVSADGRVALAPVGDGIAVFDISGRTARRLARLTPTVAGAALSSNGRLVATGHSGGLVQIWDVRTGRRLARADAGSAPVSLVSFSPDAAIVVTGDRSGTVRLFSVRDGKRLATLGGHRGNIVYASFSGDGRLFATQSVDGTTRVWQTQAAIRPRRTVATRTPFADAAFTAAGRRAITSARDGTLRVWQAASGRSAKLGGAVGSAPRVGLSPDGRFGLALDRNLVRVWRLGDRRLVARVRRRGVIAAAVAPRRPVVALAATNGRVVLHDAASGDETVVPGRARRPRALAFSPDGRFLAIGDARGYVSLWPVASDKDPRVLRPPVHPLGVSSVAFSAGGGRLVATANEGSTRAWSLRDDRSTIRSAELAASVGDRDAAFSSDGRLAAGWGEPNAVRLWGTGAGVGLDVIRTPAPPVAAAFARDGSIVIATADGAFRVYSCAPCAPIKVLRAQVSASLRRR